MSSPQQQNALIIPSIHAPFEVAKRAVPSPGPGQVIVKIMAVALNPVDYFKAAHGDFLIDEYPTVLGHDLSGVVEQLGDGVEGFKVGDRVFSQALNGGFQQYTVLPAAALMRMPTSLSFNAAATFPITFPTACVGLFAPVPLGAGLNPTFSWDKPHKGESALVVGGGTSTGQYAIQLLKFLGYTQIVVYASKKHFDFLRTLGATECIDRAAVSPEALPTHEAIITSVQPPLKLVYEAIGNVNLAYDCVADGGQAITVHPRAVLEREGKTVEVIHVQGYYVGPDVMQFKGSNVKGYGATPEHTIFGKWIMKNLPEMIEKGVITPNRYEVLPGGLSGIVAGLERLKNKEVSGVKLVAHPQDN